MPLKSARLIAWMGPCCCCCDVVLEYEAEMGSDFYH